MNTNNAALVYRQASFENAPPIKIVRLLYEGAIRYIDRASNLLASGDRAGATLWAGRADAIVEELRMALDPEHGPDNCANLDQLYDFVQNRLSLSVVEQNAQRLAEARKILTTLLEGWMQVEVASLNGN